MREAGRFPAESRPTARRDGAILGIEQIQHDIDFVKTSTGFGIVEGLKNQACDSTANEKPSTNAY